MSVATIRLAWYHSHEAGTSLIGWPQPWCYVIFHVSTPTLDVSINVQVMSCVKRQHLFCHHWRCGMRSSGSHKPSAVGCLWWFRIVGTSADVGNVGFPVMSGLMPKSKSEKVLPLAQLNSFDKAQWTAIWIFIHLAFGILTNPTSGQSKALTNC